MTKGSRAPDGAGSVYRSADGKWHARVTMGVDPATGKTIRRHVQRATRREAWEALETLRDQAKRGAGTAVSPKRLTVAAWLDEWLAAIVVSVRPRTWATYESLMRNHVVPSLGSIVLDRVTVTDVNRVIARVAATSSSMVADNTRRTLRVALGAAVDRGLLVVNPVDRSVKPKVDTHTPPALKNDQIRRLIALVGQDRNAARWIVALFCGLRQGEALGLRWTDIDWAEGTIRVSRQVQRLLWRHGCTPAHSCGKKPASCPKRHSGGLRETPPKSADSVRTIVPPPVVMKALAAHRQRQTRERLTAVRWERPDVVFTNVLGGLIDPRGDYAEGKDLLRRAGVPEARLHTLRHTAVTAMLEAGISSPMIAATLGWSPSTTAAMLGRYGHVRVEHLRAAAVVLERSVTTPPQPGAGQNLEG